ncbi:MAG TPA: tetratricopeptide repeat protein [Candidatus Acidoferrales bacterium]|nr:tetratricopeptide repeat protein [Candidatus Acidoferrales bacterium]
MALNSKWQDGWWSLGFLQYQSNDYSAAQNSLTHFLEFSPRSGPALALRGLCEFETGDYSQSLEDIQSGLALGAATGARNEQVLRYHAALLLTRAGSFQGALQQYTWFADKGISSPDLFLGLGLAGLRSPKLPQDVPPDDNEMFTLAGSAIYQFMAHRQDQAAQAFQDFFRRYPKAANAHYVYGYLLVQADPDHAIQEFKRELEVSPSNAEANVMLAWTYLLLDEPAQALPYARSAFVSQPSLSVSLLVLGRSLVGTGNLKDGAQYLEKAALIDPNNLEIHIALAHVYSEEGRKQDSWRERQLSLQLENHGAVQSANQ